MGSPTDVVRYSDKTLARDEEDDAAHVHDIKVRRLALKYGTIC